MRARPPILASGLAPVLWALLGGGALSGCGHPAPVQPELEPPVATAPLTLEVDPFIGTANEGQTFPGAVRPWGLASPSPHTTRAPVTNFLNGGLQANAGYVSGQPKIHGFGLTHLSGVGCPDYGAPVVAAVVGAVPTDPEGYGSPYDSEVARAGYYAAHLSRFDVWAEATATPRVGVLRFWFPASRRATLVVDTAKTLSWVTDAGEVEVTGPREIQGSVGLGNFCASGNQSRLYFVLRASRDADATGTVQSGAVSDAPTASGDAMAFLRFDTGPSEAIEVQVGLSWVSVEGALKNLEAEAAGKTFADVHGEAALDWQGRLGRLEAGGGSSGDRTRLYTALYHALIHPNVASDVDGSYLRFVTNEVATASDGPRYTVFSLWDTYRTVHPLLTLLYPDAQLGMLRTLADMTAAAGAPPLWELSGDEAFVMVGDPAAIVVADSYVKGLTDFDAEGTYQVMKAAAEDPAHRPGIVEERSLGYVPMELASTVWGPASTTLEYAVADHAMARLAEALGHPADVGYFDSQAADYQNLFDASTGTLRPKNADGSFLDPFDPDASTGSAQPFRLGGPGYVEGTAWSYAFFAPHDEPGLVALHGPGVFVDLLQWVFDTGRFAMWNEPDIDYPYLFTYVGGEWARTQQAVRDARATYFGVGPGGIPGNDDAGAMSAWFVFAAMGFYPVARATDAYQLGDPLFDRLTLHLDPAFHAGGTFVVERGSGSPSPAATLNGAALPAPSLTHGQITAGGTLQIQ